MNSKTCSNNCIPTRNIDISPLKVQLTMIKINVDKKTTTFKMFHNFP